MRPSHRASGSSGNRCQSNVSLRLNVDNLLDKNYVESDGTTFGLVFGTPRSFLGSVRVEF